ncbi:retrovirus-related pol polyprotein from transposon TNT 1-94 [Tanacetum coccineum]
MLMMLLRVMMFISYLALLFGYYMKKKHRGSHVYFTEYGNCLFSSSTKWVIDSGASDHMTETFQSYMLQHGILHESSCVYRPAQNGVAERKNRHLLEDTQLHCYLVLRDVTFHEDLPYFPVTTYRCQEENDDLLVYVSPAPVETTKQSTELDGPPIKVYARRPQTTSDLIREPSTHLKDAPIDATNDVSNDVPISAPSEAYGKSDAPSDASRCSDSPLPPPTPELDLPIALRKGKCTCIYSVSGFVSYDGLSTSSLAFVANIDSISVPKTVGEALAHFGWCAAMIEEMNALDHNSIWALVDLPIQKKPIGCKWVFSVKMNPDGSISRLKARLVAKGYAHTHGIDYFETFSPAAKISSIRLFISLPAAYDWALH